MKNVETQEKLFGFIASWASVMCKNKEEEERFYIYLGEIVQSQIMGDLVHLKENCPAGYDVAGDMPLLDYFRNYNLDEVYNNFFKKQTMNEAYCQHELEV